MASTSEPRLLTWTIPTPQGLWYRAIVMIDQGIFVTPRIDATTLKTFKAAALVDANELVDSLTGHGRSKRPQFVAWSSITGIRLNTSTGSIEIERDDDSISVTVPDRDRLEKLARVLVNASKAPSTSD